MMTLQASTTETTGTTEDQTTTHTKTANRKDEDIEFRHALDLILGDTRWPFDRGQDVNPARPDERLGASSVEGEGQIGQGDEDSPNEKRSRLQYEKTLRGVQHNKEWNAKKLRKKWPTLAN